MTERLDSQSHADKEHASLIALEAKATPGPWVQEEGNFAAIPNGRIVFEVPCQGANDDDLPFLIALRNAWPQITALLSARSAVVASDTRSCTCHPDDNPPRPCPRKFALNECREAAQSASEESITLADIREQIDHIEQNGFDLKKYGGQDADEGRCRELCALFLRDFINAHEMQKQIDALDRATKAPADSRADKQ